MRNSNDTKLWKGGKELSGRESVLGEDDEEVDRKKKLDKRKKDLQKQLRIYRKAHRRYSKKSGSKNCKMLSKGGMISCRSIASRRRGLKHCKVCRTDRSSARKTLANAGEIVKVRNDVAEKEARFQELGRRIQKRAESILPENKHVWMQGNRRNPLHQATNVLCQRKEIVHQKKCSGEWVNITATSGASSSSASRGPAMDIESRPSSEPLVFKQKTWKITSR